MFYMWSDNHDVTFMETYAFIVQMQYAISFFYIINLNAHVFVRTIRFERAEGGKTKDICQTFTF